MGTHIMHAKRTPIFDFSLFLFSSHSIPFHYTADIFDIYSLSVHPDSRLYVIEKWKFNLEFFLLLSSDVLSFKLNQQQSKNIKFARAKIINSYWMDSDNFFSSPVVCFFRFFYESGMNSQSQFHWIHRPWIPTWTTSCSRSHNPASSATLLLWLNEILKVFHTH